MEGRGECECDSVGMGEWEGMKGDSVRHDIRYCEKNEIVQSGRKVAWVDTGQCVGCFTLPISTGMGNNGT